MKNSVYKALCQSSIYEIVYFDIHSYFSEIERDIKSSDPEYNAQFEYAVSIPACSILCSMAMVSVHIPETHDLANRNSR